MIRTIYILDKKLRKHWFADFNSHIPHGRITRQMAKEVLHLAIRQLALSQLWPASVSDVENPEQVYRFLQKKGLRINFEGSEFKGGTFQGVYSAFHGGSLRFWTLELQLSEGEGFAE